MGQRIIGLTGGIATGKSTVSHYLETHQGLPILDADLYAREAVAVGAPILAAIAQRYGPGLLHADGSLNRPQLGQIIFNDQGEKGWVEQQIHPFVRQRFAQEMATLGAMPTVVQAIPLLFEANLTDQVTEIWVVTCPEAVQIQRLMVRDGLDRESAIARIRNQWPLAEKAARAHYVIANDTTLEALYPQVERGLL
ncbi:dephospho-CoA kinase [Leptolyngbya sp. PCC 6406]|uniref:dephospho-CoA kinase n=1 Tax=Leptolyngbya sp. PCC 6406 TaxID=1173264 RepID=UPI0002ACADD7|nr:dephospho-CoA kinase [Leptolyngbya sp. PCC 6406]